MKELARYFDDGSVSGEYSQELDEAVAGVKNSEDLFGTLVSRLYELNRSNDIERAAKDAQYRDALLKELQLA